MELTKVIRASDMRKKRASKEPYEGYTLPASAERGGQFIDFNEPYKSKVPFKRIVKKRINDKGKDK
jgi:hypothetical protein